MAAIDGMMETLSYMESSLASRVKSFGPEDKETIKQWKKLNTEYNIAAMKYLQMDEHEIALELLNRSKQLISATVKFGEVDDRRKLMAITYNNMSCLFKRKNLLKTALGYAEKALKLETQSSKADNPACTHLNLCAILSRLGRHKHALEHCQCALDLLKSGNGGGGETPGLMNDFHDGYGESSILAVCYHNMAVEQEHLGQFDQALQSYYKSVEVAGQELGPDHPIARAFAERADEAQAVLESKSGSKPSARGKAKLTSYDKQLLAAGAAATKASKTPR